MPKTQNKIQGDESEVSQNSTSENRKQIFNTLMGPVFKRALLNIAILYAFFNCLVIIFVWMEKYHIVPNLFDMLYVEVVTSYTLIVSLCFLLVSVAQKKLRKYL
jgi:hypothetical protein